LACLYSKLRFIAEPQLNTILGHLFRKLNLKMRTYSSHGNKFLREAAAHILLDVHGNLSFRLS
jgi:hypothetical protein